jgi:hypothetical protein
VGCGFAELAGQRFDIIINATSASLSDAAPDLPVGLYAPGSLAYDMMYGRVTPFLRAARAQGAAHLCDGLGMLVEQAAESFQLWRGVRPETAPCWRSFAPALTLPHANPLALDPARAAGSGPGLRRMACLAARAGAVVEMGAPSETSFMSLRLDELNEKKPDAELRYRWVPYEQISLHLKRAVVAAEDDKFVDHEGFDWDGIQKAIEKNQKKGKAVAGGSTISQQLAKNLSCPLPQLFPQGRGGHHHRDDRSPGTSGASSRSISTWSSGATASSAAKPRPSATTASAAQPQPAPGRPAGGDAAQPRKYETSFGPRLGPRGTHPGPHAPFGSPDHTRRSGISAHPSSTSAPALGKALGVECAAFPQSRLPDAIRRIHLAKQSVRRAHGRRDGPSFRQLCKKMGAGLAVSEMVTSNSLLYGSAKTQRRANHDGEADPISVQIAGADPAMMAEAARHNIDRGAQIIDINMGCPAKKVCNVMAGSALMQDEPLVARILEAVVGAAGNTRSRSSSAPAGTRPTRTRRPSPASPKSPASS